MILSIPFSCIEAFGSFLWVNTSVSFVRRKNQCFHCGQPLSFLRNSLASCRWKTCISTLPWVLNKIEKIVFPFVVLSTTRSARILHTQPRERHLIFVWERRMLSSVSKIFMKVQRLRDDSGASAGDISYTNSSWQTLNNCSDDVFLMESVRQGGGSSFTQVATPVSFPSVAGAPSVQIVLSGLKKKSFPRLNMSIVFIAFYSGSQNENSFVSFLFATAYNWLVRLISWLSRMNTPFDWTSFHVHVWH